MPQTEDIEYIKKYEAYDCINDSEDDDFDPLDELINRFSQKYTFSEISRPVYRKIVENRLVSEIKVIKKLRPELNIDSLFSADELAKAVDQITADTYNIKSGARPAITAVSKFIDSKLLSQFSRMAKTYRLNQN